MDVSEIKSDSISDDQALDLDSSPSSNIFYNRRGSAIDRFTDPENITNYLCGYSIRICTLYILWIHITFMFISFIILILGATYVRIHFEIAHQANETIYMVKANNQILFSFDTYSAGLNLDFGEFGYRILELFLSIAFVDICVALVALIGVYSSTLYLLIPYLVSTLLNISCLICFTILEMGMMILNLIDLRWFGYTILGLLLTRDVYRFFVLYSYFRLYGKKSIVPGIQTPPYLTTEAHLKPIGIELEEIKTPMPSPVEEKEKIKI